MEITMTSYSDDILDIIWQRIQKISSNNEDKSFRQDCA